MTGKGEGKLFPSHEEHECGEDNTAHQAVDEDIGDVHFVFSFSFLISALHSIPLRTAQRRARA